jgi:hypothetical protein
MEGILLVLFVLIVICVGRTKSRSGGVIVKDMPKTPKPKIYPAPQPMRNKQGRTKDEQELHEWMEDNPR